MRWYAVDWEPDSARIDAVALVVQVGAIIAAIWIGLSWKHSFLGQRKAGVGAELFLAASTILSEMRAESFLWVEGTPLEPVSDKARRMKESLRKVMMDFDTKEVSFVFALGDLLLIWMFIKGNPDFYESGAELGCEELLELDSSRQKLERWKQMDSREEIAKEFRASVKEVNEELHLARPFMVGNK